MGAEMSERGIPAEVLARDNAELRKKFEELRQDLRSACDARDLELNRAVEQEERAEQAEAANAELRAALDEIRRIPAMPFPDPCAHSWRAFGQRVFQAWSDIRKIADAARGAK